MTEHQHYFGFSPTHPKVAMANSERDLNNVLLLENKKWDFLRGLEGVMKKFQQHGQSTLLPPNIADILAYSKSQISELSQSIKQRFSSRSQPRPDRNILLELYDLCDQLTNSEIHLLIEHLQYLLSQRRQNQTRVREGRLRAGVQSKKNNV